jgi:hypothetical protein
MIRLLDVENGRVIPTEHCHTIKWLKAIMDQYEDPEVYINVYAYIFYMTCPSQENPFYNVPESEKEDQILDSITLNFDTEDDVIIAALEKAEQLYETPTLRAYLGMKKMIDNLADYMGSTKILHGRDGNISALVQAAKNLQAIRESFKGLSADLAAEQETKVRGGKNLGYDQM